MELCTTATHPGTASVRPIAVGSRLTALCDVVSAAVAPGSRHERGDIGESDASRESRQHVCEVLDGVDVVEGAGAKHRVGDGRALSARVAACKEKILSSQLGAHVKAFDDTVVDGDDAIVEEARQRHVVHAVPRIRTVEQRDSPRLAREQAESGNAQVAAFAFGVAAPRELPRRRRGDVSKFVVSKANMPVDNSKRVTAAFASAR